MPRLTRQGVASDPSVTSAGVEQVEVDPRPVYDIKDAREFLAGTGINVDAAAPQAEGTGPFATTSAPSQVRNEAGL